MYQSANYRVWNYKYLELAYRKRTAILKAIDLSVYIHERIYTFLFDNRHVREIRLIVDGNRVIRFISSYYNGACAATYQPTPNCVFF